MFNVKIDLKELDSALAPLRPGGKVQMFLDTEIIKHCDPYVPRDTGMLAGIGSGQIVYNTPYAEKVYTTPELNFQGAPMRGAFWAPRMWADRGKDIMQGTAKLAGGKAE